MYYPNPNKAYFIGGPFHDTVRSISERDLTYGIIFYPKVSVRPVDLTESDVLVGLDRGRYELFKFSFARAGLIYIFRDSDYDEIETSMFLYTKFVKALGF